MESQVFDLEKIKEITKPIDDLQGKLSSLDRLYEKVFQTKNEIKKDTFTEIYYSQMENLIEILQEIYTKLMKISNENVNKFLILQDDLIKKYKDSFKEDLKNFNLNQNLTKTIGLNLIKNKKISKIITRSSFIPAITSRLWLDLIESLKSNSLFKSSLKKIKNFYESLLQEKLEIELSKIPDDINPSLIDHFKQIYMDDQISFNEFLNDVEARLSKEKLEEKKKIIEETKEKEKIKQLQKKQEQQQQSYQDYFKLSEEEFKRRRRKQKRKSLKDIAAEPKKAKEISEEVSEKIEKFKSEIDRRIQEEYIIKKDEETDPLDLIRERRKKKTQEYNKFIKKFENKE